MTTRRACEIAIAAVLITGVLLSPGTAAPIVFEDSGVNAAAIQDTVDKFRAALGNPNNGNTPGPLPSGRREINWDGGGQATTVSPAPFAGFLNIRGALLTTPGTDFVQAPPSGLAALFNPTYNSFGTFSDPRLFGPINSTVTNVDFFVPGSNGSIPATATGFGAVFSDVDTATGALLTFFSSGGGDSARSPLRPRTMASRSSVRSSPASRSVGCRSLPAMPRLGPAKSAASTLLRWTTSSTAS